MLNNLKMNVEAVANAGPFANKKILPDTVIYSGEFEDANLAMLAKVVAKTVDCNAKVRKNGKNRMVFFVGYKTNCYVADKAFTKLSNYLLNRCKELAKLYINAGHYDRKTVWSMVDNYMCGWIDGLESAVKLQQRERRQGRVRLLAVKQRVIIGSRDYLKDVSEQGREVRDCETTAYCRGLGDGEGVDLRQILRGREIS